VFIAICSLGGGKNYVVKHGKLMIKLIYKNL